MAKIPLGLVGIAVLQVMGSLVSIVLGMLLFAVSMAPPMGGLTGMPFIGLIVAGSPAIMGFFGLLFAILMLLGLRPAWYLSLVYWTVLGIFSSVILSTMLVNADWSVSSNWFMLLIPLATLLFSVVSFIYFRTGEVKDYFGLP
jgi:hypothetical protein